MTENEMIEKLKKEKINYNYFQIKKWLEVAKQSHLFYDYQLFSTLLK